MSTSKVFVGNLNFDTTSEQINTLFSQVGEVVEVFVPTDRATGRPRGFAFVEFTDPSAAAAAIEKFSGHELDGRPLRVNEAQERPPRRSPSWEDPSPFGGDFKGKRPAKPKGSRRNMRGKKRSL